MATKTVAGQKFNNLTAIEPAGHEDYGRRKLLWKFQCDCGKEIITRVESVRAGGTKSCGCRKVKATRETGKANRKHGQSDTRIYRIWNAMQTRCSNPKNCNFEYYGGRQISVCKEWLVLDIFREWALANGYAENLTIDRYPDKDGNYEPTNCRWITIEDQQRNRRPRRWWKRPPATP